MQLKKTKKCNKCFNCKEISEFSYRNKKKGYLRGSCKACDSIRYKKYREDNLDKMAQRMRIYRKNNNENINEWERKYRKKRYSENKDIRKKALARRNKRRAKEAAASFKEYKKEITEIYKNCPEGYEVDHIMPLQGNNICGLHVPWNLQYLEKSENRKKSNKVIDN